MPSSLLHSSRSPYFFAFFVLAAAVIAATPSCSTAGGGGDPSLDGGDGDSSVPIDSDVPTDGSGFDIGDKTVTSLVIDPASTTLTVTDLAAPPNVTLHAFGVLSDGSKTPVTTASWTVDRYDLVTVGSGTGLVTATGKGGGKVTVTATAGALSATADVTINLKLSIDPAGSVDPSDKPKLDGATTPDPAVTHLLYPYDKTVFPKGLLGPEVMWNGGAAGDEYVLKVKGPYTEISIYALANPPSVLKIDNALWTTLTTSVTSGGVESDVSVELHRMKPGGTPYVSAKSSWHVADANLRGTIFYWAVNRGEIVKIKPGATAPISAFDAGSYATLGAPTPLNSSAAPTPPWSDNGSGKKCVACHAVSKDGTKLSGVFSTPRGSTGPLGFVDVGSGSVGAVSDYAQNGTFVGLSPDGKKAALNTNDMKLHLLDATSGAPITTYLETMNATQNSNDPAFSNDGKLLAFAGNVTGAYPVEYSKGDLQLLDFVDASNTFSGLRTLVTGAGATSAIAFPSFSPDSKFVFYQAGDYSRANYGTKQHGVDNIYAVGTGSGSAPIKLDALNGVGVTPTLAGRSLDRNYQPTVNPIAEGGYFWVVFVSPRDYGNKMSSSTDASYDNRKQLWVAAVDASMKGPDPSHPAFWLPGQLLETINMSGYWTLEPCKPTPKDGSIASCEAGFECCSGFCRAGADGKATCVDPPTGCHKIGEKCTVDADCCGDGTCIGGFCGKKRPS